jgi:hypothetical protein
VYHSLRSRRRAGVLEEEGIAGAMTKDACIPAGGGDTGGIPSLFCAEEGS